MFWPRVLSGKDLLLETGEQNTLVGEVSRERMGEREDKSDNKEQN